ncbi:MAG: biopolymer transporter ExbD [Melioribacteraceae bacterium]|nr:biopolymer transporter ExbD [Melioribacteraceae bacterium]
MVKIKKGGTKTAEIPTSSMADIAFLLLLFFLVATVIDVDTGIGITLPEYQETPDNVVPISQDRMAALLINENGDVLLNKEIISIPQIKDKLISKIESKIDLPSNKKLVVSIKTDRKTNYNLFMQAFDQVKIAYRDVKNNLSMNMFGVEFDDLAEEQQEEIKNKVPEVISFAEPEKIK